MTVGRAESAASAEPAVLGPVQSVTLGLVLVVLCLALLFPDAVAAGHGRIMARLPPYVQTHADLLSAGKIVGSAWLLTLFFLGRKLWRRSAHPPAAR